LITRGDIPIAQQAVQAAHAAVEHAYIFGRPANHHPTLVHVTVEDKTELYAWLTYLTSISLNCSSFEEPHKNWGLTAIACSVPSDLRALFKHLPLWKIN